MIELFFIVFSIQSEYEPPPVNVTLPTFHLYETGTFQFGKVCRKNHFLLEVGKAIDGNLRGQRGKKAGRSFETPFIG